MIMEKNLTSTLTLFHLMVLIGVSGFFGGVVSSIFDILSIGRTSQALIKHIGGILGKALIGVAGAFAVILVGFWMGHLTIEATVQNEIFLISLCIVSGTVSYRLLPKIGKKLEDQIAQTDKKAEEAKIVANKSTELSMGYSYAIAAAASALARGEPYLDAPEAITKLESIRSSFPRDRAIHIFLGRLYRSVKDYGPAISVLSQFIKNRTEEREGRGLNLHRDEDISAAYFNIACYYTLKAKESPRGCRKEELDSIKESACVALSKSIELWPQNKEIAEKDPDFEFIRKEERFKELVETKEEI